jgi:hypothetical protein
MSIGRDRMNRGNSFEQRAFVAVQDLVINELKNRDKTLANVRLNAIANVEWIDQEKKHVGEVGKLLEKYYFLLRR